MDSSSPQPDDEFAAELDAEFEDWGDSQPSQRAGLPPPVRRVSRAARIVFQHAVLLAATAAHCGSRRLVLKASARSEEGRGGCGLACCRLDPRKAMLTCTHACMHVRMHACMHACMYASPWPCHLPSVMHLQHARDLDEINVIFVIVVVITNMQSSTVFIPS
eukprot:238029-Chlamydomonas_euryale.AAC.16